MWRATALAALLASPAAARVGAVDEERLIGWKGEIHRSAASPPAGMDGEFDADAYVTLRSGARMPRVGFGTAGLGDRTALSVGAALAAGYRLLDSAQAREWYREDLVGAALEATALPRESVFVTTKIHPRHLGYAPTAERVAVSLRELRTRHVDLLLLHYPACWGDLCGGDTPAGTWRDSWRALEAAKAAGQARALGVSNFDAAQLRELLQWAKEPPDVVQAHSDPFSQNRELQRVCAEHGVVFQAYSSLGLQWWGAGYRRNPVLHAPVVEAASVAHRVTPAQVVLRWALHRGQCIIPKTSNPEHMRMNRELGFTLTQDELAAIDALDGNLPPKEQYA